MVPRYRKAIIEKKTNLKKLKKTNQLFLLRKKKQYRYLFSNLRWNIFLQQNLTIRNKKIEYHDSHKRSQFISRSQYNATKVSLVSCSGYINLSRAPACLATSWQTVF